MATPDVETFRMPPNGPTNHAMYFTAKRETIVTLGVILAHMLMPRDLRRVILEHTVKYVHIRDIIGNGQRRRFKPCMRLNIHLVRGNRTYKLDARIISIHYNYDPQNEEFDTSINLCVNFTFNATGEPHRDIEITEIEIYDGGVASIGTYARLTSGRGQSRSVSGITFID